MQTFKKSPKLVKIFGTIFFMFGMIPWVNFGLNNNDSQPWTFIFSIIFLILMVDIKLPKYSLIIFFFSIFGLITTFFFTNSFATSLVLRAIIGYLSLPVLYVAFYNYFIRYGFPIKLFILFNILWISIGFLEPLIPELIDFISKKRTNAARGVTSLAPEPTFFAVYLFFSSWIIIESKKFIIDSKKKIMILINIFCIIFLAKSTTVAVFLILVVFFLFIYKIFYFSFSFNFSKKKIINYLLYSVVICSFIFLLRDQLNGSRIYSIFSKIIEGKSLLSMLKTDWSVNSRVESVYLSVVGTLDNYLIPAGLDTFKYMRLELFENMIGDTFANRYRSMKVSSWNGSLFFELGIFGICIVILFFKAIYRNFKGSVLYFLTFFIILFSAIPIGFTLVPMLFSLMVFNKYNHPLGDDK